jgi:hypothetical protein
VTLSKSRLGTGPALVAAAAAAGALLSIAAFYPGYMSTDSVFQLWQARTGSFDAWHPPVMAWVWSQLDGVLPGPGGMLVLQNAMFWAGLGLAAAFTIRSSLGAVLVLVIGLLPPVFALLGTIWKDVQMGAALVLAVGLMLGAERRRSRTLLLAAVAPLWYAAAVRLNAATAILPIAVWWGLLAIRLWKPALRGAWSAAVGAALTMLLTWTAGLATAAVLHGQPTYPLQDCFVHDLVAISMVSGRDELPAWEYEGTGTAPIEYQRTQYSPITVDPLVYARHGYRHVTDPEKVSDLRRHWVDAVLRHPGAWFQHRLSVFSRLLGIVDSHLLYWDGIDPNPFGIVHPRHGLNRAAMAMLESVETSFLFRGWFWWAASLAFLAWAAATGRASVGTWTLAASGTLYLLPYFEAAPSDDFRYIWWVVLAALLAPLTLRPRGLASEAEATRT